ncbi:hypothetical protein [Methanocalculus sp. MC3]
MRKPKIENWSSDPSLDNMLFFAQLMEEMLFDYTIDSYKAPVFNTHSLCDELLDVLSEVEKGFLHLKAASPILEELLWNLHEDLVVKELLGIRYSKVSHRLKDYIIVKEVGSQASQTNTFSEDENSKRKISIKKLYSEVETLKQIFDVYYLDAVKTNLFSRIVEGNKKKDIIFLVRTLIAELRYLGYSQQHIYYETMHFFFLNTSIETVDQINEFLGKFSGEQKTWVVIFKIDKQITKLNETKLATKSEIIDEIPIEKHMAQHELKFIRNKNINQIFIKFEEISALDPFQARLFAEQHLVLISNLVTYKTHKEKLSWDVHALVYSEDKRAISVTPAISPMLKIRDIELKELQNTIDEMIALIRNTNVDTFYLLFNSLNLHACALQSKTPENQLMNMWTALETLMPPPTDQRQRILQFTDAFEPFLGRKYIQKLVNDLLRSLNLNLSDSDLNEVFSKIPSQYSKFEKCALLVALKDENEDFRDELYNKLGRNPLLTHRIFSLMQMLHSSNHISNTIIQHNQRVRWQLQRIYRARNLITHKGEQIQYVSPLLENAHSYYHTVIDLVKEIREKHEYTFNSLNAVFNWVKIEHEAHLELLKKDEKCSQENFKEFLFGV